MRASAEKLPREELHFAFRARLPSSYALHFALPGSAKPIWLLACDPPHWRCVPSHEPFCPVISCEQTAAMPESQGLPGIPEICPTPGVTQARHHPSASAPLLDSAPGICPPCAYRVTCLITTSAFHQLLTMTSVRLPDLPQRGRSQSSTAAVNPLNRRCSSPAASAALVWPTPPNSLLHTGEHNVLQVHPFRVEETHFASTSPQP